MEREGDWDRDGDGSQVAEIDGEEQVLKSGGNEERIREGGNVLSTNPSLS